MTVATTAVTAPTTTHGTREVQCYPTIGVDPGAQHTGVAVRVLDVVLDAATIDHGDEYGQETVAGDRRYIADVLASAVWMVELHQPAADRLMQQAYPDDGAVSYPFVVAVEGVNKPSLYRGGKKAAASPKIGWNVARTMLTLGAVLAAHPGVVVVAPGGNGEFDRPARGGNGNQSDYYPSELRRVRPARFTTSTYTGREHERSAYDVAGRAQEA